MQVYIVRPHRDNAYYYLSPVHVYKSKPIEMSEEEIRTYCSTLQQFHHDQGKLAILYKPLNSAEEFTLKHAQESLND